MAESAADKIKREVERKHLIFQSILSIEDFLAKELPPKKWIAANLIPEGFTILSSAPGQFKTYMLLAMCKQISNGEMVLNYFQAEKRGILFINEEMGERAIQDRINLIPGSHGDCYISNLAGIKLDDVGTILKFCKEKNITLVIFDSLTRIHNLKENDADDVKKIFETLVILLKEGISVIMTHHHRKTPQFGARHGSEEMRGSIDILAQIDCHLSINSVAPDKSYLTLKQGKMRDARELPEMKISIIEEENRISFKYRGNFSKMDEVMQKIEGNKEAVLRVIEENPGIIKKEIIARVEGKLGKNIVKDMLPDMEGDGVIYSMGKKPKKYFIKNENEIII